MAFWNRHDAGSVLAQGDCVILKHPHVRDYPMWRDLREKSRALLQKREPAWDPSALSLEDFRHYVQTYQRGAKSGRAHAFFIWHTTERHFLGACHLTNIRRGAAQMASLGYWLGTPFHGHGYMRQAVGLVCHYAFHTIGLHRIEAACMPDNIASQQLLIKNGFVEEGYAGHYLQINGRWEDHVLFGLTQKENHGV